jgi:hypothetical protein
MRGQESKRVRQDSRSSEGISGFSIRS